MSERSELKASEIHGEIARLSCCVAAIANSKMRLAVEVSRIRSERCSCFGFFCASNEGSWPGYTKGRNTENQWNKQLRLALPKFLIQRLLKKASE